MILRCLFCSSHFRFWSLFLTKFMKIWKYYVIFVYIFQGKMGKTEKMKMKTTKLKWPKYQKLKDENMWWTKQLVRRNIHFTGIWCQSFDGSSFHTQNIHTSVWTIVCLWVSRKSNWYMEVISVLDTLTHYSHYGHTLITLASFCLFLTN